VPTAELETGIPPKTGEQLLFERYRELGRIARDADEERKGLREEIEFNMDAGVVLGDGTQMLVYEFTSLVGFDWERAAKDGKIDVQALKDYFEHTPVRKVIARAVEPKSKGARRNDEKLRAQGAALQMMDALEAMRTGYVGHDIEGERRYQEAMDALKLAKEGQE
jgi:hypothetical protein